jgi:hypothetical protein
VKFLEKSLMKTNNFLLHDERGMERVEIRVDFAVNSHNELLTLDVE